MNKAFFLTEVIEISDDGVTGIKLAESAGLAQILREISDDLCGIIENVEKMEKIVERGHDEN